MERAHRREGEVKEREGDEEEEEERIDMKQGEKKMRKDDEQRLAGLEKESGADPSAPFGYEYLDHPADVQIHAWGTTIKEAYEQAVVGMFGYMTDLSSVEIDDDLSCEIEAEGHDNESLLFALMDEFLFNFSTEFLVSKQVEIVEWDKENFKIRATGKGETFDLEKHPQGTEVKAITYSAMQVVERPSPERCEVFVIIDI